jgi:hypothetical protein
MGVPILQKIPSFGEEIARGLGGGISQGLSKGFDFMREKKLIEAKQKKEDLAKFEGAGQILEQMRSIKNRGNIGRGSGFLGMFPGQTARDRAEFEQLGKSLIPLVAAGVPIRNQREFDEYKKVIVDASSSDDQIEGAINGLEKIFNMKLEGKKEKSASSSSSGTSLKKVKPGTKLTLDVMKELHKKTQGNEKKARQVAKELGYDV